MTRAATALPVVLLLAAGCVTPRPAVAGSAPGSYEPPGRTAERPLGSEAGAGSVTRDEQDGGAVGGPADGLSGAPRADEAQHDEAQHDEAQHDEAAALDLTPRAAEPWDAGPGSGDGLGPEAVDWGTARARGADDEPPEPAYGAINLIFGDRDVGRVNEQIDDYLAGFDPALGALDIDLASQKVFGLEGVVLPVPRVPLGFEAGVLRAASDDAVALSGGLAAAVGPTLDTRLETLETYLGLRAYLHRALPGGFPLEPFASAGLSRVFYDLEVSGEELGSFSRGDGTGAWYLRLGLQGRIHRRLHVGVDVRWLEGADATLDLGGGAAVDVEFDHRQVSVFAGVRL